MKVLMEKNGVMLIECNGIGRKIYILSWTEQGEVKAICYKRKGWAIIQFNRKVKRLMSREKS